MKIQIALPRRRAAMAPRSPAESLSASSVTLRRHIDRALHHWGHVPALDGGPRDHDLDDSGTDTAIPDDDDDVVSPASCAYESVLPSSV